MFSLLFFSLAITVIGASPRSEKPIFDLTDESKGYSGTIGERNVLVDMKPHLQIKNIDAINGICSYHVFKPNSEEFPFTIEIKDKLTGEAIIEIIKRELDHQAESLKKLDCNKRKLFTFLLQAHDCSEPSIASDKVPVNIEIIDHDDSKLEFESTSFYKKVTTSAALYENLMVVRAKDEDCTNNGYACSYRLVNGGEGEELPFRIDNMGSISSTRSLLSPRTFTFGVRAFDCVSQDSFVEKQVTIDVVEPCLPHFSDFQSEISTSSKFTNLFGNVKLKSCGEEDESKASQQCRVESVVSKVELLLDQSAKIDCETEKCDDSGSFQEALKAKVNKKVLFPKQNELYTDDDSLEESAERRFSKEAVPINYQSFSKTNKNAQRLSFDGKFGNEFTLSAWIRKKPNADKNIKEQIFCGTDLELMNRHHFGLYFYKGSIKFLLRHEPQKQQKQKMSPNKEEEEEEEVFYPSLWEWSLSDQLQTDSKWHFYEIKFSTSDNVNLFIDGVRFMETKSNSDIIDAYELNNIPNAESITTYVGACYHARTKSLVDFFEGDIGQIVLKKKSTAAAAQKSSSIKCFKNCKEYMEINLVGNENFLDAIKKSNQYEISVETSNLNDMVQLLRKINYVNKNDDDEEKNKLPRSIRISSFVRCSSDKNRMYSLNEIKTKVSIKHEKNEYNLVLEDEQDTQIIVKKNDLSAGVQPFKHMSIIKMTINKLEKDTNDNNQYESDSDEEYTSSSGSSSSSNEDYDENDENKINLSRCVIKITPQRNLMAPGENNEKLMFLQSLMDKYNFKFEESIDQVIISGIKSVKSYETFLKSLTYKITNLKENEEPILIDNKQFDLSCLRNNPNIETNTITAKLRLESQVRSNFKVNSYQANKQVQRLVVAESPEEILRKSINDFSAQFSDSKKNTLVTSPIVISFIVMSCCAITFLIVVSVIKMRSSGFLFKKSRKLLINEENPQMEWDDSGLTITENPLEAIKKKKSGVGEYNEIQKVNSSQGFADQDDDEYDEYASTENSDDESTNNEYDEGEEEEDENDYQNNGEYEGSNDGDFDEEKDEEFTTTTHSGNNNRRNYDSDEEIQNKLVVRDLEWDDDLKISPKNF